jgi:hypothetical protein
MRTMITVTIPVEGGNKAIKEGTIEKTLGEFMQTHKPEAAYFTARNGTRTMYFVVDLKDASLLPVIAEPFFGGLNASVDFVPAMNLEELKKGLEAMQKPQMAAR